MVNTHLPEVVAANLRRIRLTKGISLSRLARDSGVAKGTLSKLEAGVGNPTMATMFALADNLGTTLGELIADHGPSSHVVRADEGPRIPRGVVDTRYINRFRAGLDLVEIYELNVDPERTEESEPHPPGVYEHVLVLEGPMLVGPSEDLVRLNSGDYIFFRADRPHRYIAAAGHARALCLLHYPDAVPNLVHQGPASLALEAQNGDQPTDEK